MDGILHVAASLRQGSSTYAVKFCHIATPWPTVVTCQDSSIDLYVRHSVATRIAQRLSCDYTPEQHTVPHSFMLSTAGILITTVVSTN